MTYEYKWVDKYNLAEINRLGGYGWRIVPGIQTNMNALLMEHDNTPPIALTHVECNIDEATRLRQILRTAHLDEGVSLNRLYYQLGKLMEANGFDDCTL